MDLEFFQDGEEICFVEDGVIVGGKRAAYAYKKFCDAAAITRAEARARPTSILSRLTDEDAAKLLQVAGIDLSTYTKTELSA